MASSLWPIQQAIYSTLTGDAILVGMITGVFDHVPENQPFPYVTMGEGTEVPFRTFGRNGSETTLTMHIWSQYEGFKEALDILSRMNDLLDDQPLAVAGYSTVLLLFEHADTMLDSDGITRHVPVRYRMVVQSNA